MSKQKGENRPTQRAADGGYVPHFRVGFWLEAFPFQGPVQPIPPPLTLTVSPLRVKYLYDK